jgi:hypothetical protein
MNLFRFVKGLGVTPALCGSIRTCSRRAARPKNLRDRNARPPRQQHYLNLDDIEIHSGRLIDRLYAEQQAAFPIAVVA